MSSSGPESSARRRALALLAALTVALAGAAWMRRPQLGVTTGLTAPDDPLVALDREVTDEFGLTRPVVFVVVARDGNVWTEAGLAKIVALTRDVLALPGVLPTDVISLASPNMRDVRSLDSALEQTYLMAEVPRGEAAIAALRRRVDGDPNYGGQLVSRDGAAALVVANFLPEASDATIAAAALATRARHIDATVDVVVTGAPVAAALVEESVVPSLLPFLVAALLGVAVLAWSAGTRTSVAVACAGGLAIAWGLAVLVVAGRLALPWSLFGLATGGLIAALLAVSPSLVSVRRAAGVAAPPVAAGVVLALAVAPPASALGGALAIGAACGVAVGILARMAFGLDRRLAPEERASDAERSGWLRLACFTAIALAWLGTLSSHAAFGVAGYGERFLPAQARGALDAMRRHFPPPTTFVVRLRGAPGFVSDPALLSAMDGVVGEMRAVPGVRSAQSLADIVKLVHRSFNDDDPEFFALPEDRGLVARYLALAYSPGFRRFVDRGLSRTALWVYADGDDPATLERVHERLREALARHPAPGAELDPISGDGALALRMARTGWQIASGTALAAAVLALVAALTAGAGALRTARDVLAAALSSLLVGAGIAAWLGLALDLVVLPLLACVALTGGVVAVLARERAAAAPIARLGAGLAVAALPLALAPFGAARVLVPLLVTPLAALAAVIAVAGAGRVAVAPDEAARVSVTP
jgi:hypothetical protein